MTKNYGKETILLHAGQEPDPNTGSRAVPIHRTTSYVFKNSQHAQDLFALKEAGNIYTRIMNPTVGVFEDRVAQAEGGTAAVALSSGMAAIAFSILNIASAGDEIIAASNLYGGTYNLFVTTLPRYGITVKLVDVTDPKAYEAAITDKTRQRVGIFAGSGVGKSTLLGMIARNTVADINVIALIGERGREVREFIERDLGPEGLKKTIVVAATSDQPALMRIKGAFTATAIAEYFREKGYNVMLMMDSVTRVAMAQREIGLAVGEPPATRGYTPSVFAILPKLLERTGTSEKGAITAFYTVLVDGDDMNEPIADAVRGILDGHIVLDRTLANKGQYPAINVLKSVSRLMNHIASEEHVKAAERLRELYYTYDKSEDLINIGAYKRGTSREIDEAIEYEPLITNFLKQGFRDNISAEDTVNELITLAAGGQTT